MDRGDYILTQEGQENRLLHRRQNRLYFIIAQQPKGKSISQDEKTDFQRQVLQTLQDFKKRAYRSNVVMEIDFHCNQKNPPAIHTLAKKYLDLLSTPVQSSNIKRKNLLYSDDKLIKFLTVNYHVGEDLDPRIFVSIDSFRNFIDDVKLLERIIHNDFNDSSYSSFDIHEIEREDSLSYSDPYDKLDDLNSDKDHIISVLGKDTYDTMKDFAIQDAQKDYLEIGKIAYSSLSFLFGPYLNKAMPFDTSKAIEQLSEQNRNLIISPPFALDLNHTPVKKGQKRIFKENVVDAMENFKKRYPILSPLKVPLGVIVLYVPPLMQSVDLDNLARYIMPFINNTMKPPLFFVDGMKSVARYQFLELPRLDGDPPEGYVRLIFDNPFTECIWRRIDKVIDKWEDSI